MMNKNADIKIAKFYKIVYDLEINNTLMHTFSFSRKFSNQKTFQSEALMFSKVTVFSDSDAHSFYF